MQPFEQFVSHLEESIKFVGENLNTAMVEVAQELGGDELAARVSQTAAFDVDSCLPNVAAMKLLVAHSSEAEGLVTSRMKAISEERWAQRDQAS